MIYWIGYVLLAVLCALELFKTTKYDKEFINEIKDKKDEHKSTS
tara:strand:+ start:403 stop:534 length:132 start_codon:yes stop_codon:yes gene_type:complete